MPENPQEQTEAKLLAYIEGELDESGRAEIERHIEANPKHRKLLDELSAGRRLLRLLPREVAPLDLYENVQSQLERQELLSSVSTLTDGAGGSSGTGYDINPHTGNFRLSRWGRIRAAAAIALLASGIGIVGYNITMPGNSRSVAIKSEPATRGNGLAEAGGAGATAKAQLAISNSAVDELRRLRMAGAADHVRNLDEVRSALAGDRVAIASPEPELLRRSATDKLVDKAVAEGGAGGTGPDTSGHEPFYLVVASGDPASAREDVLSLLSEKGLTYSRVAMTPAMKPDGQTERQLQGDAPIATERKRTDGKSDETSAVGGAAGPTPAGSPAPGAAVPAKPKPVAAPSDRAVAKAEAGPAVEEVVIVRRVPRSRAAELVAAMNRPASARYALAYGDASDASNGTAKGGAFKQSFGAAAAAPAKKISTGDAAKFTSAAADGNRARGALADAAPGAKDPAAQGAPALVTPAPSQTAPPQPAPSEPTPPPAAAPAAGVAESSPIAPSKGDDGLATKPTAVAGAGQARDSKTQGQAIEKATAKSKDEIAAGSPRPAPAEAAPTPAPGIPMAPAPAQSITPPAPLPAPISQNASRTAAVAPAPAPKQSLQAEQHAAAPLAANEAIELVYLDMRVSNRPVTQPMRISARGTIYVAGFGEFSLAGMTPSQAAEKLSSSLRAKTPTSRGVEIRRSVEPTDAAAGGLAQAAQAPEREALGAMKPGNAPQAHDPQSGTDPAPFMDRTARKEASSMPAGAAPAKPGLRVAPMAKASPGSAGVSTGEDDYVDLVIVVQRDMPESENTNPVPPR